MDKKDQKNKEKQEITSPKEAVAQADGKTDAKRPRKKQA